MMDNINKKLDLYYNFWSDLNFDQNDLQPVPDTLPVEKELPTEQEALQLTSTQHYNAKDIDDIQYLWEIFE